LGNTALHFQQDQDQAAVQEQPHPHLRQRAGWPVSSRRPCPPQTREPQKRVDIGMDRPMGDPATVGSAHGLPWPPPG